MTQTCSTCKTDKPLGDFVFRKKRNCYRKMCKTCESARRKVRSPYLTEVQKETVRHMYREGKGAPEIARLTKFGSRSKISAFIQFDGLSRTTADIYQLKAAKFAGNRFGRLVLVERVSNGRKGQWRCKCDCGNETVVPQYEVTKGGTRSCGCLRSQSSSESCHWEGCGELSGQIFSRFRHRAAKRDLSFSVTIQELWALYLAQHRRCAFTGIPIYFGRGSTATASLDRKDSSRGYVIDNVQWVHKCVNIIKREMKDDDLLALTKAIYEHHHLDQKVVVTPLAAILDGIKFGGKAA